MEVHAVCECCGRDVFSWDDWRYTEDDVVLCCACYDELSGHPDDLDEDGE
jgi:hypothetical protein